MKPWLSMCLALLLVAGCADEPTEREPQVLEVGPEGGTLSFGNGVTLEFPPGAVSETTAIEVDFLPIGRADAILLGRGDALLEKRCLGGFLIEPTMEFGAPVKATVPILPPRSHEVMWEIIIDYETGEWWPTETDIAYFADRGVVEFEFTHTSSRATAGATGASTTPEWFEQSLVDLRCRYSSANPECDALDPAQPSCCLRPPGRRESGCICCREKDQRQQSNATEFSRSRGSNVCEFLSDRLISTYYECQNPDGSTLVESHVAGELSPSCSEDTTLEVEIRPNPVNMLVCDTQALTATVRAVSEGGEVIPSIPVDVLWRAPLTDKVRFVDDGVVEAISPGSTLVFADVGIRPYSPSSAKVNVRSNVSWFGVEGPAQPLEIDEQAVLTATLIHDDGGLLDPSTVRWSGGDPTILLVDSSTGAATTVTAVGRGCVNIEATYQIDCETVRTSFPVCVECSPLTMAITPESADLVRGESTPLRVDILDEDGTPLDTSGVLWTTADSAVARVGNLTGPQTLVEAVNQGQTEVVATYDDFCQLKDESAVIDVGCVDLEISDDQVFLDVDESHPLSVRAVDADGDAVLIPEAELRWESDNLGAVTVSPRSGRSTVSVRGVEPGHALITVSYDDGACDTRTAHASVEVTEDEGIGGTWKLSATSQRERCRYTGQEWWTESDRSTFLTRVRELPMSDRIVATYLPHLGPVLTGRWDEDSSDFELATASSDPAECAYLLTHGDVCGDAINCQRVSCRVVTVVEGTTDEDLEGLNAASEWYYSVTFAWGPDDSRGETTWECEGSSELEGERL